MAFEPADHVGERVRVVGTAVDARAGAIVHVADNTPIYVSGLQTWDDVVKGKRIEASGVLRLRPSRLPPPSAAGEQHPGLGETFALDEATWLVVEAP